jgi:2-polyprenyl-3-methyl-5-hydroxy-6-metoxy-1,4-benzoquinol methylase
METSTPPRGRTCPVCGGEMFGWLASEAAEPADRTTYAVDRCETCGLGVTRDPPAEALALHESGSYGPGAPRLHRLAAPLLASFDRARLRLLHRHLPKGASVLEIGAGRGRFLARLAGLGYQARGLEPSPHRRDEAVAQGLAVEATGIEDADVAPGSQDAVVAWHVLEHLPDPGGALDRAAKWLRPDGLLLLGVPNAASLQVAVAGSHWFHLDLPRHRFHFTPTALETLLGEHGFEVDRVRHLIAEHNLFGMWQTLLNGLTFNDDFLFGVLKRSMTPATAGGPLRYAVDALVTLLAGVPALAVAVPLELAAGVARRGGTFAVVARRSGGTPG